MTLPEYHSPYYASENAAFIGS
uniref:Uncharacterized protein n=1 Tax=Arundo donax TaxID=35708 RepID=A0A0A8YQL3_ARUDO